jgi:hypothetical protein
MTSVLFLMLFEEEWSHGLKLEPLIAWQMTPRRKVDN